LFSESNRLSHRIPELQHMAFTSTIATDHHIQSRPKLKMSVGKDREILDMKVF